MDYRQYRDGLRAAIDAPSLAFAESEYEMRIAALRAAMRRRGFDLLLVSDAADLCWLTGYTTFEVSVQCVLLVDAERCVLFVPAIEIGPAVYLSRVDDVLGYAWEHPAGLAGAVIERIRQGACGARPRIGLAMAGSSLRPALLDALRAGMDNARFEDMDDLLDGIRLVKSPAELEVLATSARITAAGLDAAGEAIREGIVDHEIAAAGAAAMLAGGSEFMSMQPIVSTGFRSGIIHTSHAGHAVMRGDAVFMEFGAAFRRYTAPMMRTAVLGAASAEMREFHAVGQSVLAAVMAAARSGATFDDAARAGARALAPIADRAFFSGVYGYPVGVQFPPSWVAGRPFIAAGCQTAFATDMVFHLPICLRKPGAWGIGLSETVRITADGARPITSNRHQLREIG